MGIQGRKVAIIDDELSMIRILERWLKVAGYVIVYATDGERGITLVKEERPDLILLDLMLPGMGGVEVARHLQQDEMIKDIPVIFVTAMMGVEQDKGDETINVEGQLYPIFAKPLHNAKLLSSIRKAINRRTQGSS